MAARTLRPYQEAAQKSLFKYIAENKGKILVVAPVASGKSLMIAEFIRQVHELYPRTKIVMITHVKELLVQNAEELMQQYPQADVGFYCAGLGEKKLHCDITFASIQSISKKAFDFNNVPQVILIDECHLISHKADTLYQKFINDVLSINKNCKVIGYTGTPFRADTGRLDQGKNKLFDDVAYEIGMDYMINEGYWAKPVAANVATKMDVTGVGMRGGDYIIGQLQEAINKREVTDACVAEMVRLAKDRKKWLVFTATVKHCEDVCAQLIMAGVNAAYVTGKTPKTERDEIINAYRRGEYQALVNVAVLTTGFNVPDVDMLAFMRPTRSPVLYIQTVGRGVRPVYAKGYDLSTKEGRLKAIANSKKPDCMILDFGGVVGELGPIDQVSIHKTYEGEKDPSEEAIASPIKICPSCATECANGQRYCYSCGHSFIYLTEQSGNNSVVSQDVEPEWVEVYDMYNSYHRSADSIKPSMKVTYVTTLGYINEWVCFEHHSLDPADKRRYAWEMAVKWHNKRLPNEKIPTEVYKGIELEYPKPSRILVKKDGKYWKIKDYDFSAPEIKETDTAISTEIFFEDIPF